MIRILFICLTLLSLSFAKSELYFLPQEAKEAKNRIIQLIDDSQKSITIAMYNFSYKKFAKALAKASKRGVDVVVIFDSSKIKKDNSIFEYLKDKGITCVIGDKKMHLKAAIFDNKRMLLGSTNFTKKSFSENYEILYINENKKSIKKLNSFLKEMI